jgi:hypothetical protein
VTFEDTTNLAACATPPPYPCGKKGCTGVDGGKFRKWGDKGGLHNETVEEVDKDENYGERCLEGHSDGKWRVY